MSSSSSSFALSARGSRMAVLVLGLCWLAVLFDGLDMFIYGSVLPHMLAEKSLGLTPDRAGDLGSYATFGMLIGALTAGTVADRVGRKKLMVACVTLSNCPPRPRGRRPATAGTPWSTCSAAASGPRTCSTGWRPSAGCCSSTESPPGCPH